MPKYTPGMVKSIGLVRRFDRDPWVEKFTPFQLGIIWLHSSCLEDMYHEDRILCDFDWDYLTDYLVDKYKTLPAIVRDAIPFDCVDSGTSKGIDWNHPFNIEVCANCLDFTLLMDKKRYGSKQSTRPVSSDQSLQQVPMGF